MSANTKRVALALGIGMAAAAGDAATAQSATSAQSEITVPRGTDLRVTVDAGGRIRKVGQPVHATLAEPLYIGQTLAVPQGARVEGHVSAVTAGGRQTRVARLLDGDFTPPRTAEVVFDTVVSQNGTRSPIATAPAFGMPGVHMARYVAKGEKGGLRAGFREAEEPLRAPHKLQRLGEAAWNTLPVHPNFLDQGTVYDAVLEEQTTLPVPAESPASFIKAALEDTSQKLYLRLTTGVTSAVAVGGGPVTAVLTRPYANAQHTFVYPAGTELQGRIASAKSAGWWRHNGSLRLNFSQIQMPDGAQQPIDATLDAVEAPGGRNMEVDVEGALRFKTSLLEQGLALNAFVAPSLGVADRSYEKTALERGGAGQGGFGFVGAGAAQASATTAIGFGYYGAAKAAYSAFVARGSDVVLPINTPFVLRLDNPLSNANSAAAAETAGDTIAQLAR